MFFRVFARFPGGFFMLALIFIGRFVPMPLENQRDEQENFANQNENFQDPGNDLPNGENPIVPNNGKTV